MCLRWNETTTKFKCSGEHKKSEDWMRGRLRRRLWPRGELIKHGGGKFKRWRK